MSFLICALSISGYFMRQSLGAQDARMPNVPLRLTRWLEEHAHEGHDHVDRDDQDLDAHLEWTLINLVRRAATPG